MTDIESIIKEFTLKNQINTEYLSNYEFPTYKISNKDLKQIVEFIKSKPLYFTILIDLFASDFPKRDKRFEVVYSFLSLQLNKRILFKIELSESEKIPSLSNIYSNACWYEREAFDMFGIYFADAKDLRRILTDYEFNGHPLRKDFPLSGHSQVRYDEDIKKVIYEPVNLEQDYRDFDFCSEWKGPKNLPGDEKATNNNVE